MTVPEAVHLILRAAALGTGGETYVFDMGEPLNIYELAKTMLLFAGLKPDEDLRIEFTGLKPGEKVNEQLWETWERPVPTECKRILVIRGGSAHESVRPSGIVNQIRRMETLLARGDRNGLLDFVHEMFPDFRRDQREISGQLAIPAQTGAAHHVGAA
jgi:FlaA1/EpsC-like NDP-sugar epimerase